MTSRTLVFAAFFFGVIGCGKSPEPAPPDGSPGGVRLEIQYNAVRALAHRGSPKIEQKHLDLLAEMLDEQKQLQNFRIQLKDGKDVPDVAEALTTVEAALKALADLHAKRPDLDLSSFNAAVEKLTQHDNKVIQQEAKRTQIALAPK